jgi:multimeric flavodoxin WrbA
MTHGNKKVQRETKGVVAYDYWFFALTAYSMYGHIDKLADSIEEGLKSAGVSVSRFQFPETLAPEVLEKMHAAPKKSIPVLTDPTALKVSQQAIMKGLIVM